MKNITMLLVGGALGALLMYMYLSKSASELPHELNTTEIIKNAENGLLVQTDKLPSTVFDNSTKEVDNSSEQEQINASEETKELFVSNANDEAMKKAELAEIKFDDFINAQPPELIGLIDLYRREQGEAAFNYKNHISEEKDIDWAYEAESFLQNYFNGNINSEFKVIRIDCRTNTCEVAGVIQFDENAPEGDNLSRELYSVAENINKNLLSETLYGRYFYVNEAEYNFSAFLLQRNPSPYAFFLKRSIKNK